MITDGKNNWHYLSIKCKPVLLRHVTSTHNGDFYCLNCFYIRIEPLVLLK